MVTRSDPSSPEEFPRPGARGDGASDQAPADPEPGQLLDQVLNPLLADFEETFARGLQLLAHCPDRVLPADGRAALRQRLLEAQAGLHAARALRAAAPPPPWPSTWPPSSPGMSWWWRCGHSRRRCGRRGW